MGYQMITYKKLRDNNEKQFIRLMDHHNVGDIEKLSDKRIFQIALLRKTVEALVIPNGVTATDEMRHKRVVVYHAMTFYIRESIYLNEYKNAMIKNDPMGSCLYRALGDSLVLTPDNQPTTEEMLKMYKVLCEFIYENTYINSNPAEGSLPLHEQMFTQVAGFDAVKFLKGLEARIAELKPQLLNENKIREEEKLSKPSKSGIGSYVPAMFKSTPVRTEPSSSHSRTFS